MITPRNRLISACRPPKQRTAPAGRAEGGQLGGELVHGQRRLVPGLLITGQRGGERPSPAQAVPDRVGQQLGVAQGVADPLPGGRVHHQAGIPDQGPARAPGPAEAVGQIGTGSEPLGATAGADPLAQVADEIQGAQDVALDITPGVELRDRPGTIGHRQPVVGRPGAHRPPLRDGKLAELWIHPLDQYAIDEFWT